MGSEWRQRKTVQEKCCLKINLCHVFSGISFQSERTRSWECERDAPRHLTHLLTLVGVDFLPSFFMFFWCTTRTAHISFAYFSAAVCCCFAFSSAEFDQCALFVVDFYIAFSSRLRAFLTCNDEQQQLFQSLFTSFFLLLWKHRANLLNFVRVKIVEHFTLHAEIIGLVLKKWGSEEKFFF